MADSFSFWTKRINHLPSSTQRVVLEELKRPVMGWTVPRPFLPGEPICLGRGKPCCQGDWPVNEKGKLKPCPGETTHVMYAVGGVAHGLVVCLCARCAEKFADPTFDWTGSGKARW